MNKYEKNEEIRAYTMAHVNELAIYLLQRGLKFDIFKNLVKNEFILKIDNMQCICKSCRELCELLEDFYNVEKKKAFKEYVLKKLEQEF